jgi:hypothetical protein
VAHPQRIADRSAGPSMVRIDAGKHVPHPEPPDDIVGLVAAGSLPGLHCAPEARIVMHGIRRRRSRDIRIAADRDRC